MAINNAVALKLACSLIMCMVILAPLGQAITCGEVAAGIGPCMDYLKDGGDVPERCCIGASVLSAVARTKSEHQKVCECMKVIASDTDISYTRANALPSKCGYTSYFTLGPHTDCSSVN